MSERVLDTAVIPVAGLGTRMAPFTWGVPKFMMPVNAGSESIPSINFAFDECVDAGIENIVMIVGTDGRDQLERYIGRMSEERRKRYLNLGKADGLDREEQFRAAMGQLNIEYIVQDTEKYGTAIPSWLALRLAQPAMRGVEHVAVTGGDDFVWHVDGTSELALAKAAWQGRPDAAHAIMGVPVPREIAPSKGILMLDQVGNLNKIIERPDGSDKQPIPEQPLANISRYIFTVSSLAPELERYVASELPKGQREYQITDVVNNLVASRETVAVHHVTGAYLDTGTPEATQQAGNYITAELRKADRIS